MINSLAFCNVILREGNIQL